MKKDLIKKLSALFVAIILIASSIGIVVYTNAIKNPVAPPIGELPTDPLTTDPLPTEPQTTEEEFNYVEYKIPKTKALVYIPEGVEFEYKTSNQISSFGKLYYYYYTKTWKNIYFNCSYSKYTKAYVSNMTKEIVMENEVNSVLKILPGEVTMKEFHMTDKEYYCDIEVKDGKQTLRGKVVYDNLTVYTIFIVQVDVIYNEKLADKFISSFTITK